MFIDCLDSFVTESELLSLREGFAEGRLEVNPDGVSQTGKEGGS